MIALATPPAQRSHFALARIVRFESNGTVVRVPSCSCGWRGGEHRGGSGEYSASREADAHERAERGVAPQRRGRVRYAVRRLRKRLPPLWWDGSAETRDAGSAKRWPYAADAEQAAEHARYRTGERSWQVVRVDAAERGQ